MTSVERLRLALRERAGLDFTGARATLFAAGLGRAARDAGEADEESYARRVLAGELSAEPVVVATTVGETWFFRDPAQWAFVEEVVLPDAAARRGRDGGVRAWSAGCSTGEEPYTLAMILAERGALARAEILGTDLSEAALAAARRAEYSLWSLRGAADARARRHLRETGARFALDPEIARHVHFFPLNLARADYPSPSRGLAGLDLVLCRNVLIYLAPEHLPAIARRLFDTLAPGAWLLTGAADPSLANHAPFEVRAGPFGVAYLRPEGRPAPLQPPRDLPDEGRRIAPVAARPSAARRSRYARPRPDARAGARPPPPVLPPRAGVAPGATGDPDVAWARALLDHGRLADAAAVVDEAIARRPLDAELHFVKAVGLSERGQLEEAEASCRRALYLAREEPFLHFFLAMIRMRRGDSGGAARAFRRATQLASRRPAAAELPLSHGMTAATLVEAARFHLGRLDGARPADP